MLSISELSLTERLPFDLLESILSHADPPAICAAGGVCRTLRRAAHAEAVWRMQLRRLGLTEAGIACAAAATDPSADAWELEDDDDVGAGRLLRRMGVRLWAREPCTAELVRRRGQRPDLQAEPGGLQSETAVDVRLSNPFVGERAWVIMSDGEPSTVAFLARAATGRGDELVFEFRANWAGRPEMGMLLSKSILTDTGSKGIRSPHVPGEVARAFELDDGIQLMRHKYNDLAPMNEPPRVCFSICRRLEAVGDDGRRLGPIESIDAINTHHPNEYIEQADGTLREADAIHEVIGAGWAARMTHVSFELLRQVSLPAGVCD